MSTRAASVARDPRAARARARNPAVFPRRRRRARWPARARRSRPEARRRLRRRSRRRARVQASAGRPQRPRPCSPARRSAPPPTSSACPAGARAPDCAGGPRDAGRAGAGRTAPAVAIVEQPVAPTPPLAAPGPSPAETARAELHLLREARAAVARRDFSAALVPIAEHARNSRTGGSRRNGRRCG